jgi:hypothetical protein
MPQKYGDLSEAGAAFKDWEKLTLVERQYYLYISSFRFFREETLHRHHQYYRSDSRVSPSCTSSNAKLGNSYHNSKVRCGIEHNSSATRIQQMRYQSIYL